MMPNSCGLQILDFFLRHSKPLINEGPNREPLRRAARPRRWTQRISRPADLTLSPRAGWRRRALDPEVAKTVAKAYGLAPPERRPGPSSSTGEDVRPISPSLRNDLFRIGSCAKSTSRSTRRQNSPAHRVRTAAEESAAGGAATNSKRARQKPSPNHGRRTMSRLDRADEQEFRRHLAPNRRPGEDARAKGTLKRPPARLITTTRL